METPPDYIFSVMGMSQEQWKQMSKKQRLTVAETTASQINDAVQELYDFLMEEIVIPLMEASQQIAEALVDCAATVETEIEAGRADMSQATPAEQAQIHGFLNAAHQYDQAAGLNKMGNY